MGRRGGSEIALRLALGGRPWRIVRQLLTESLALAVAGGVVGLVLSFWAMKLLVATLVPLLPLSLEFTPRPDVAVLAVTMAFAVLSDLTFGLGPAVKLSRVDVVSDLKSVDALARRAGRLAGSARATSLSSARSPVARAARDRRTLRPRRDESGGGGPRVQVRAHSPCEPGSVAGGLTTKRALERRIAASSSGSGTSRESKRPR